ncbi:uncharacterized protein LOC113796925 [Dermatophagoides pteronyssinus]|uniref:Uncharacterized protein n=1 Tax=Dermatophagoides pteronyssinus TaxID=6956 RepID=A0ABQ8JMZ4_DERPT|nr:hypothetical protein DERP_005392 [Dermatophagoides pteronyssinus]
MNKDFENYFRKRLGSIKYYDTEDFLQITRYISDYSYHFRIAELLNIPFRQWLWLVIGLLISEILILWIVLAILIERLYVLAEFEHECKRRSNQQRSVLMPPNTKINISMSSQSETAEQTTTTERKMK